MSFAEEVKYERETLFISKIELASMVGVSFSALNRCRIGKHEPSFLNRKKFEMFCKQRKYLL